MDVTIFDLTIIILLGIFSQWIAWRINLPSIPFLLLAGFLAGPIAGWINPDRIFGDALFPIVSLAVAIILFEGGLSLKIRELKKIGLSVVYLLSIGVTITWLLVSLLSHYLLELDWNLSILMGAILIVTGPTVISPILRAFPIRGQVGSILKWEGIIVDSMGAVLSIVVFEVLFISQGNGRPLFQMGLEVILTISVGILVGLAGSWFLMYLFRKDLLPDFLQNPVSFVSVLTIFTVSNRLQHESGLIAVTILGVVLANQTRFSVRHIIEFKENLQVLLLSGIFVLLSARIRIETIQELDYRSMLFLGAIIFLVRPASVFFSSFGSGLSWTERAYLSWMAPRGIVAAAVSSVFSLELVNHGYEEARILVPVIFLVIVGTVTLYGLTAKYVAGLLNLAIPDPQGILFLGAQPWVRSLAKILQDHDFRVVLVDTNRGHVRRARLGGLEAFHGNALEEKVESELDLAGVGRLVALTSNDEVNSLAAIRYARKFGSTGVYQLSPVDFRSPRQTDTVPQELRGRCLVDKTITYSRINSMFQSKKFVWKATRMTREFLLDKYKKYYGPRAIPFFLLRGESLLLFSGHHHPEVIPGDVLVGVVPLEKRSPSGGRRKSPD